MVWRMKVPQRRPAAEPRWGLVEVAEAPMACRLGTIEWARHWKWKPECVIVTWWFGSCGTRAWLTSHCPSVLWHCWLGHISLTRKIVSEMTYIVSSGTLNPTIPLKHIADSVGSHDTTWQTDLVDDCQCSWWVFTAAFHVGRYFHAKQTNDFTAFINSACCTAFCTSRRSDTAESEC